ncbi:Imidazolonepropionase [Phycisphaerae bacterium RAS1]|nr:Imidazolonepropionase [Phycisphaerae bacterium RAS1]
MTLLVNDIGTLIAVPPGPIPGSRMRSLPELRDAALLIEDGRIAWFGPASQAPAADSSLSAAGGLVIPGLIDCHTHVPFAGDRSGEFVRRVAGESYLSILQSGGGIRVTSAAVRAASRDELVVENLPRLRRMLAEGVTTCECKSGYGLLPEHEIKQLEAVRELNQQQPIELVPTLLGLHSLPPEFDGRGDDYVAHMSSPALLERVSREKLARFADVFCDRGAFNVEQSRRFLSAAAAAGLRVKLHADQLAQIGASRLAAELRAVSADHLEEIDDQGIAGLQSAGVIPVVLPGCTFFLGVPHAPARKLIDAGLPLAIATDCNPGSAMIESLTLVMHIACCQLRLQPAEALAACTANAAAALGLHDRLGAIHIGHQADLTILDAPSLAMWFYTPGRARVRTVIKRGKVVLETR